MEYRKRNSFCGGKAGEFGDIEIPDRHLTSKSELEIVRSRDPVLGIRDIRVGW